MRRWHGLSILALAVALAVGVSAAMLRSVAQPAVKAGLSLPNASLTPGAVMTTDPAIVCHAGYTATVRVSLTRQELDRVDRAYDWTYQPGAQEMDHLIPLELGGANGTANIWPEPIAEAKVKDRLENELHAKACAGRMTIAAAQQCIASNWVACAAKEGVLP